MARDLRGRDSTPTQYTGPAGGPRSARELTRQAAQARFDAGTPRSRRSHSAPQGHVPAARPLGQGLVSSGGRSGGGRSEDAQMAGEHASAAQRLARSGDRAGAMRAHAEAAHYHRQAADHARRSGSSDDAAMHEQHAEHHRRAAHGDGTGTKPRPQRQVAQREHAGMAAQHGLRHGAPAHATSASTGGSAPVAHPDGIKRDDHGRFARK